VDLRDAFSSGPGIRSHGWVEQDGVIADITADQFATVNGFDTPMSIIVTRDRSWHDLHFASQTRSRQAGLNWWSGPTHEEVPHCTDSRATRPMSPSDTIGGEPNARPMGISTSRWCLLIGEDGLERSCGRTTHWEADTITGTSRQMGETANHNLSQA
jgi:hypothetical protein